MKLKITKIIGCPLKITTRNTVYLPAEYLRHYQINERYDKLIKEDYPHSLIYQRFQERTLKPNEKVVTIQGGLTNITAPWMKKNNLHQGDYVYLIGTPTGLLIHTESS